MIRSAHIAVVIALGYGFGIPPTIIWWVAGVLAVILVIQRLFCGRSPEPRDNDVQDVRIIR